MNKIIDFCGIGLVNITIDHLSNIWDYILPPWILRIGICLSLEAFFANITTEMINSKSGHPCLGHLLTWKSAEIATYKSLLFAIGTWFWPKPATLLQDFSPGTVMQAPKLNASLYTVPVSEILLPRSEMKSESSLKKCYIFSWGMREENKVACTNVSLSKRGDDAQG